MSLAATLLLVGQSAIVPMAMQAAPLARQPVATQATASARILRPVHIRFHEGQVEHGEEIAPPERRQDRDGNLWIEFS